jgi:hypothetical protein
VGRDSAGVAGTFNDDFGLGAVFVVAAGDTLNRYLIIGLIGDKDDVAAGTVDGRRCSRPYRYPEYDLFWIWTGGAGVAVPLDMVAAASVRLAADEHRLVRSGRVR